MIRNFHVSLSCRMFATLVLLVGLAVTAQAATRFVDGNSGSDGGNNCTSMASPCLTIGRAVDVAQSGDLIDIADAVYTEVLEIDRTLSLQGQSRAGTIIQANSEPFQGDFDINDDRVITVSGGMEIAIRNLTIRHGVSTSGGGLDINGVDLELENVIFDHNGAGNRAGGLRTENNTVLMTDVQFFGNRGGQSSGVSEGGALYSRDSDLTLVNVRFTNNLAGSGGGLFFRDATGTFENVAFIGNEVEGAGGAVTLRSSSPAFLNAEFRGNSAGGNGGAIYTFFDSAPALTNVLIAGNFAGGSGGGIHFESGSTQPRVLTNVTITGNRAATSRGGGIFKPGDLELRNSIIRNNSDINGQGPTSSISDFSSGSPPTSNFSLVQGYSATGFPGSGAFDGTDPNNNPDFVTPISPVGAPSQFGNLRLRDTSPLIDVGHNAFVSGVSTDLDGFSRINDGVVDLGPYETGNDALFRDRFEP
jgi:predicted outer membrane repeat protein